VQSSSGEKQVAIAAPGVTEATGDVGESAPSATDGAMPSTRHVDISVEFTRNESPVGKEIQFNRVGTLHYGTISWYTSCPRALDRPQTHYGEGQAEQYEDESKSLIGFILERIVLSKVVSQYNRT
jgi:hypothetical protein